jgi:hypothetical protein
MTLERFIRALAATHEPLESGFYSNGNGQSGYFARFKFNGRWHWFSVSNTDIPLALDEVAGALGSDVREIQRVGTYRNRKGALGFEATIRVAEHSFMLGAHNVGLPQLQ